MDRSLSQFFVEMQPFLLGRSDVVNVENAIGPSPSGRLPMEFYVTLVARSLAKALRELCPSVRALCRTLPDDPWPRIFRCYLLEHPPEHRDPNRFGDAFPSFLRELCEVDRSLPPVLEELADFHVVEHTVATTAELAGDGFGQRLVVREYTHDVPRLVTTLLRDRSDPLLERKQTIVLIYRSLVTFRSASFYPSLPALAVLARRHRLAVPLVLQTHNEDALAKVERELIELGILSEASCS